MSGCYGKKVLWEAVENNFVEETNDNYEIGLRGVGFNLFDVDRGGGVR